jgi:hypothetical protein
MKPRKLAMGGIAIVLLGTGWGLFRPELPFVNYVEEELEAEARCHETVAD